MGLPEDSHCTGYTAQYIWNKSGKPWIYDETEYHVETEEMGEFPIGNVTWLVQENRSDVRNMVIAGKTILNIDRHRVFVGRWVRESEILPEEEVLYSVGDKWYF
jgi:hypothetical protein